MRCWGGPTVLRCRNSKLNVILSICVRGGIFIGMWKTFALAITDISPFFIYLHISIIGLNCFLCKTGQNKKPTVINNKLKVI
jgi:hypothetical protein